MAHDTPTIVAQPRERTGTRYAQRLRKEGRLPGIIYGHKINPLAVSVDGTEIVRALEQGTHVFNVDIEGGGSETCLIKELQFGYLGDNLIHVDFTRVNLDERVNVSVHLHFVNEPEMGKNPGAIVSHAMTGLEVECRVADIPEEIRVDLAPFEGAVTVGDIELPEGMTTALDPATPVVTISFVHKDEAEGEEVEVEASSEPEVITEKKEDDAD